MTVDEYIAALPGYAQQPARQLREIILAAAPQAAEKLSYGMPYYSYKGRLIYWGAFKHHLGLYVMGEAREALADKLKPYHKSKATFHFSFTEPLPADLIREVVALQVKANDAKS